MNKDITEITELSVIESSVSMQNEMKNSGDVARHNRERTKKIHSDNKKSAKQKQEKRIAKIRQFRDRCLEYKYGTVKDGDRIIEYKTGTKCGNIVGDRIRYILRQQKITVTDFSDQCGVGRNSLQRYLSESDPDIPTVKTLEKMQVSSYNKFKSLGGNQNERIIESCFCCTYVYNIGGRQPCKEDESRRL